MSYTISFTQLTQTSISKAGGKGANLGEMINAGFPVPAGFVLTTAAYDAFVEAHNLQEEIVAQARAVSAEEPQSSQAASEAIRPLFLNNTFPQQIAKDLVSAWQQLGATAVAVRSSATAEDLPNASFAGQQDTFLNIRGEAALLDTVKQCWASLWTARAIAYRQRQGIDPASVSLAVVVQVLVAAEASGILFTADPTTGERDHVLINAGWGLGEAIVAGLVMPDTAVVDKTNWQIVSHEVNKKTTMTVRTETGTAETAVPVEQQNEQVLGEETAVALAKLGAQIETHYGTPVDIEWVVTDGKIQILQARPITSLPPAPLKNVTWEPPAPNTIWMRRQIVEHMPEPLSPLFEDLYLRQGIDKSIGTLIETMAEMGGAELNWEEMLPHGFAGTINGYAYTTGSFNMSGENLKAILKIYANISKFFKLPGFNWEGVALPTYQASIAHWGSLNLAQATDEELLRGIGELATADSAYWWGSALNLGLSRILDPVFGWLLRSPFIRYALPEPRPVAASFLRGFDSKALDAQADMEALADLIRNSAEMREIVVNADAKLMIKALSGHPGVEPLLEGIQQFLDTYGHQIYNLDFVDPTQSEDPTPILLSLKALVKNPPDQDVRQRQAKMAEGREALVVTTRQALNPFSRKLFDLLWGWTKQYAPYRENVMFFMGAAWPTLRKLARELGQRLNDSGSIAQPTDIYYLNSADITAAIEARATGQSIPNYAPLVQERRTLREARKLLTPLPTVPERGEMKFGPFTLSMFNPTPHDAVNEGPILEGYAVSTGRVVAPASVIRSAAEFDQMQPGTILVCTTTTPAWTPLFSQAVGLVTDVGGALAHGSIVAREYDIPAVMGTGIATERIQSGMMLAIDGDKGTVTLLDEVDETAVPDEATLTKSPARKMALAALAAGAIIGLIAWWRKRKAS